MIVSELKSNVEQTGSPFFDRASMRFFGDTMRNYGVRSSTVSTYTKEDILVWELYRKHSVKHGLQSSTYFDKKTFRRIHAGIH